MASKNVLFSLLLLLLVVLYAPPKALAATVPLNTRVTTFVVTGNLIGVSAGAGSVATVGIGIYCNGETTPRAQTMGQINQIFSVSVNSVSGLVIVDIPQPLLPCNATASVGGQQFNSGITLVSTTSGTTAGVVTGIAVTGPFSL